MSREITQNARSMIYAATTSTAVFTLMSISHSSITTPYRFVNNNEEITSNENTYSPSNFSFTLPDDTDGEIKEATISICNVDRAVLLIIQNLATTPTITIEVVLSNSLDDVEVGPYSFTVKSVNFNLSTITAALTSNCHIDDYVSVVKYTPQKFPGQYS